MAGQNWIAEPHIWPQSQGHTRTLMLLYTAPSCLPKRDQSGSESLLCCTIRLKLLGPDRPLGHLTGEWVIGYVRARYTALMYLIRGWRGL